MKLKYLLIILTTGILQASFIQAQDSPAAMGLEPDALSPQELIVLASVPLLELPDTYKGPNAPLLPVSVDNSTQPYFRPITTQSGYECGQSAGIAFNFTYEIDRLRNIPANTGNNQYPTHFTWNFLNDGYNYTGASFFDSWEIVRACGNMNVTEYGGTLNYGGEKRWISGYSTWYNGMKNRLISVKAIRVDTPEGLQTLKYWLHEHLEGSSVGGVASFYAKYFSSVTTIFPPGTPEAGKYVQTSWGPSPSHAWTVCGYNDSVRYDYNSDGQYTNTIDITGDGVVDMHDWEVGGLKFANGYAGTGWCDQGFCYLMYKTLADDIGYGGIWNHTVYVVDVKETCNPQLTMKVTLKHTCRNKLKVTVGMSTNISASSPDHIYEYPVFNYQGGPYFMQGGTDEAHKTIEFGLDMTHILSELNSNQPAKYFLQVHEVDPGNSDQGEIVSMSVIDYTSGSPQYSSCSSTNVPLVNNGTTTISVTQTATFSKPDVTTSSLPAATLYQPYSCQLTASGGTQPYLWDVDLEYPEIISTAAFPAVTQQTLIPTNSNYGYAIQALPFPFPYYQQLVNTIYVYVDGFILFDDQPYTYPYLVDPVLLFRQTHIISPFMTDLRLYYNQNDGMWFEEDANSATIRWKASINGQSTGTDLNFAVKLYPNGIIEYYYGNMNYPLNTQWTGGLSGGDNHNYQYSQLHNHPSISNGSKDIFTACGYPVEMKLSDDGIFSGTPQYAYTNQPITFRVTDNNGISNISELEFTTNGLLIDYVVTSGGDSLIEYGETAFVSISLTNLGQQPVTGVDTWIEENDPWVILTDSSEYIGTVNPAQTLTIPQAFAFQVSTHIPDLHPFTLMLHLISNQNVLETNIDLVALAPVVNIGEIVLLDGDNGRLDPGETTDLEIFLENHGHAGVESLDIILTSLDPLLTVNQSTASIPLLEPDTSRPFSMNVTASPQAPFEHLYLVQTDMIGNDGFVQSDSIWLFSGEIIEDYESGNFYRYPWSFGGFASWNIDVFSPYEGDFCAKSGWIFDGEDSHMLMTVNVLASGEISFYKWISCEDDPNGTNYDYLAFFLDNEEMDRWDGIIPWSKQAYPVSKGIHTFKWIYHKDESVSANHDCSYIDFVSFPPFEGALSQIEVDPLSVIHSLDPGQTGSEDLMITNTGGGMLNYTIQVFDTAVLKSGTPESLTGSGIVCSEETFVPGEAFSWTFSAHNASTDGQYIKHIRMDLPDGMTVTDATNFSGGSLGDLEYDGTTGTGATINWHGESAGGRGVIKPDETAVSVITGTLDGDSNFDIFIVYTMEGDSVGALPHLAAGEIRVVNEGLSNTWLSLSSNTGGLLSGDTDDIELLFNAGSLPSGDYFCDLLVRDLWNNITEVPVLMHVNWPVQADGREPDDPGYLASFPNPFAEKTTIRYRLERPSNVNLEITNLKGIHIRTLVHKYLGSGEYRVSWNGTDSKGTVVEPGVYLLKLSGDKQIRIHKLVVIR